MHDPPEIILSVFFLIDFSRFSLTLRFHWINFFFGGNFSLFFNFHIKKSNVKVFFAPKYNWKWISLAHYFSRHGIAIDKKRIYLTLKLTIKCTFNKHGTNLKKEFFLSAAKNKSNWLSTFLVYFFSRYAAAADTGCCWENFSRERSVEFETRKKRKSSRESERERERERGKFYFSVFLTQFPW